MGEERKNLIRLGKKVTDRIDVKLGMGGNKDNPNVIEVIDIACDECPVGGYLQEAEVCPMRLYKA